MPARAPNEIERAVKALMQGIAIDYPHLLEHSQLVSANRRSRGCETGGDALPPVGHTRRRRDGGVLLNDGRMYETEAELDELQILLDDSLSRSNRHLRAIVQPGERTLTARQLVTVITGMSMLAIATVTAHAEPRVSGIDGHFWHGRWIFGTDRGAAKARQLAANPAVSVAHLRGEELGVFTHGVVHELNPKTGAAAADWPEILRYLREHYDGDPLTWGDVIYYRLDPKWMVAYAFEPEKLMAKVADLPTEPES